MTHGAEIQDDLAVPIGNQALKPFTELVKCFIFEQGMHV